MCFVPEATLEIYMYIASRCQETLMRLCAHFFIAAHLYPMYITLSHRQHYVRAINLNFHLNPRRCIESPPTLLLKVVVTSTLPILLIHVVNRV